MNPKQKLRKLLGESGAVLPQDKLHKVPEILGAQTPAPIEVIKTFKFDQKQWDVRAVEKMAQFFEHKGQLRERFRADGCYHLKVSFNDNAQAQAFEMACTQGPLIRN